jgi:hypothetical protein
MVTGAAMPPVMHMAVGAVMAPRLGAMPAAAAPRVRHGAMVVADLHQL